MVIVEQNLYAILVMVEEDLFIKIMDARAAAADYFLSDLATGVFHATEVKINYGYYKLSDALYIVAVKDMPTTEEEIFDIVEETLDILSTRSKYVHDSDIMTLEKLSQWRTRHEPSSTIN